MIKVSNLERFKNKNAQVKDYVEACFPIFYIPSEKTYLWDIATVFHNNGRGEWKTTLVIESPKRPVNGTFEAFSVGSFLSRFQGEIESVADSDPINRG